MQTGQHQMSFKLLGVVGLCFFLIVSITEIIPYPDDFGKLFPNMWDNLMFVSWSLSKQWEFCGSPEALEQVTGSKTSKNLGPNVATIWQKVKGKQHTVVCSRLWIGALSFISDFIVRSTILISGILMGLRIIIQNFVQFLTSAMPWFYTASLCYSKNPSWKRLSSGNMPRIVINDHHKPLDQYKD